MDSLVTLARQEGFLTTHQALHLGASYRTLHALVARGDLVHPVRSVYLPAQESSSLNREERHAVIVKGLLFAHPGWVASHHSALALSGVPLWDVPADTFHMATVRRASVRRDSLHLHVLQDGDPVGEALGLRVMTPGFAALQVAAAFGVRAGLVAVDACLRTGLTSTQVLQRMVDSGRWRRGLASARRVVELADGRSESAMESVLRLALSDGDWELEPQANLGGPGKGYRADLLVEGRVVVEYDGQAKYEGAQGHQALLAEKAREDYLRSLGYGFVRVGKEKIGRPAAIRLSVAKALADHRAHQALPSPPCGNFPHGGEETAWRAGGPWS